MKLALGLLVLFPWMPSARNCLPDAIPESDRRNITLDGYTMPVGIWQLSWDTSRISSKMFGILVSEKLGYHIQYGTGSGSFSVVWKLGGCPSLTPADIQALCVPPRPWHFAFESWQQGRTYLPPTLQAMGKYAPTNLGSGGYTGFQGLFVMSGPSTASQDSTGLPLTYFSHYNASWFRPQRFAVSVGEVNTSRLSLCSESVNEEYPHLGQVYYDATGDDDGVEFQEGRRALKCWEDRWWPAPACRLNVSDCLAVVTGGLGWGLMEMTQQAFFHNMPLAFATGNEYVNLNRELRSVLYWFTPDASFIDFKPERVLFPTHDAQEFRKGIYRTMPADVILTNWAAGGLDTAMAEGAQIPLALAQNIQVYNSDMAQLLQESQELDIEEDDERAWETACNWLKGKTTLWSQWLPRQTDCTRGQGLVDALGTFVTNASQALKCAACPPGYAAVQFNSVQICSLCPAGSFQNFPGESSCLPCEPGSVAAEEGSRECQQCSLGEFANESGMTSCYPCGDKGDEKWTTSQLVISQGKETWIQVQGAASSSLCACVVGTFLWNGSCISCMEGATCPGSNELLLLPGYFSTAKEPGEIFRCFGNAKRCPGGSPGTCALQRDPTSITCSKCIEGMHAEVDGTCMPCSGRHTATIASAFVVAILLLAVMYLLLLKMNPRYPTSLLIVSIALSQMISIGQKLNVLFRFKIEWEEPFLQVLQALDLLAFDLNILFIECISPLDSTVEFTARVMLVPVFCFLVFVIHLVHACSQRKQVFSQMQLAQLVNNVGTILSICFIPVFSSFLAPFQCLEHPNGKFTVQDYDRILCNFREEHLRMCIIASVACLLPISYLAVCTWVILVKVPRSCSEVTFLRTWSFLFIRFRPGTQVFSLFFLARNSLVVLCLLLSEESAKVVLLNLMLYVSLILTAYKKPWRFMLCNWLDISLLTGLMVIVDMAAVTMQEGSATAMIISIAFLSCMMAGILAAVALGIWKYAMEKYRKRFDFFISHERSAGCFARLLKMELVALGKTVFAGSDLVEISSLCRYVSHSTQKLVILATSDILKHKWCMAEMATAQICEVPALLLKWPNFKVPDENYVKNLFHKVAILNDLARCGIFEKDVQITLWWLQVLESMQMPAELNPEKLQGIVGFLVPKLVRSRSSLSGAQLTDYPILADPANSEAVSAALILSKCLERHVHAFDPLMAKLLSHTEVPEKTVTAVLIVTTDCFRSPIVANWIMQVYSMQCSILPIITEANASPISEDFYIPSIDAILYVQVVEAVFSETSVRFVPETFGTSQQEGAYAKQVESCLKGTRLPLSQLVSLEDEAHGESDASSEAVVEA